jgi:dihydropteroate synthase
MFSVVAHTARPDGSYADVVLGHWRGIPDFTHRRSVYSDVVQDVRDALAVRVTAALAAGVPAERIIVDPGLGFDKTTEQSWALLARLGELADPGMRVLVGASRKRMLGNLGTGAEPRDRDFATSVVSALAARAGAWAVRVHDVSGTVQALAVARAWTMGERVAAEEHGGADHHGTTTERSHAGELA